MIGTVISYCTNDFRFIGKCIEEARKFSKQIVIPVCDHFFDGTPENRILLEHTYAQNPDCQFIEFTYLPDRLYSRYYSMTPEDPDWSIFWAATARYIGFYYLDPSIESVLFLDSDEIVNGEEFLAWLRSGKESHYDSLRLAAYLYGLSPLFRAKKGVVLSYFVKKSTLAPLTLLNGLERIGAHMAHPGPKTEKVVGVNGIPFIHHYSWTRTKEECLWKARTWSHRHDKDWPTLIEGAFNGKVENLFADPYEFEPIQQAYFDPFIAAFPTGKPRSRGNVLKINDRDLIKREIECALL